MELLAQAHHGLLEVGDPPFSVSVSSRPPKLQWRHAPGDAEGSQAALLES